MIRKIISIDQDKCNGCGLCAKACHEGAIGMVNDKAVLLRDDYCDGLGDCLPVCPTGAIKLEEREAADYDEAQVKANIAKKEQQKESLPCGCPGHHVKSKKISDECEPCGHKARTHLRQWPVQIKLVPPNAPYFNGADLLIAADCTAYALGSFHEEYMKGRITLIGCPKLDEGDYAQKLAQIIKANNINSVTVARMEVPCCGGLESAVKRAIEQSGKDIEADVAIISF